MREVEEICLEWMVWATAIFIATMCFAFWFPSAHVAHADTIDYLIVGYPDEATAKNDPSLAPYCRAQPSGPCLWDMSRVLPGVQIWDPANDTAVTGTDQNGNPTTGIVHTYLPGFSLIISTNARVSALDADPLTAVVADRDLAAKGNPGFILQTSLTPTQISTMCLSPTFAGSEYPLSGLC